MGVELCAGYRLCYTSTMAESRYFSICAGGEGEKLFVGDWSGDVNEVFAAS